MKRSQVTLYIILGMILLISVALYGYLKYIGYSLDPTSGYNIQNNLEPVKIYVESCMEQSAEQILYDIGAQGGSLDPESFRYYMGNKTSYLCSVDPEHGCMNSMLLREGMEQEISAELEEAVRRCINLEVFRKQGYEIKDGELRISTSIGIEVVNFNMTYPLSFTNTEGTREISRFSSSVRVPLGRLYLAASGITNTEISEGYFDEVDYLLHNPDMMIEKHRPYPDTLYTMQKGDFVFSFALQGTDTAGAPGTYLTDEGSVLGCCHIGYDNTCYKNVDPIRCDTFGGIYDPNPSCECGIASADQSYADPDDCIVDGKVRKHGESWCEYDGIAGYGFDNVGSRHYMHYCLDGVEYEEECRDYREELCTEETIDGMTKAMCRPNRWTDCSLCMTEECCENSQLRDCFWLENTAAQNQCLPFVPQGFRHWENSGRESCSIASEDKLCSGFSCGSAWLNDAARQCYMQGDCGNYWNVEGEMTYGGFFQTDIVANTDSSAYDIETQAQAIDIGNTSRSSIDLGIGNRDYAAQVQRLEPAVDNFARIMASMYSLMAGLQSVSVSGELQDQDTVEVLQVAICEPWNAPAGSDDCSRCEEGPHPCTEYMCRSLGQGCIYEENLGIPKCSRMQEDTTRLDADAQLSGLPEGYAAHETELQISDTGFKGYRIEPEIKPYKLISIGVNTSKPSICRQYFSPRTELLSSGGYYFGEPTYSMNHTMQVRVPTRPQFPEKIMGIMNTTTLAEFADAISDVKARSAESSTIARLYNRLLGRSVTEKVKPVAERLFNVMVMFDAQSEFYMEASQKVFDKFQEGGYYMFVYCEDASGKIAEPVFFEFTISQNSEDNEPPEIIASYPANSSRYANDAKDVDVMLYLDEPAECRYSGNDTDFDSMKDELACARSRYDISPMHGGSYLCEGDLGTNESSLDIFIRCKDNPRKIDQYMMLFNYSATPGTDAEVSRFLNITAGNGTKITASAFSIEKPVLFAVNASGIMLELYIEQDMACKASYEDHVVDAECNLSEDPELGSYMCSFGLNMSWNLTQDISLDDAQDSAGEQDSINGVDAVEGQANDTDVSAINVTAVSIICEENMPGQRNTNMQSYAYSLKRSDPLLILDYGPKGEVKRSLQQLYVNTSESDDVICGYFTDLNFGMIMMEKHNESHTAYLKTYELEDVNNYYVSCSDAYGNKAEQDIRFYVVD